MIHNIIVFCFTRTNISPIHNHLLGMLSILVDTGYIYIYIYMQIVILYVRKPLKTFLTNCTWIFIISSHFIYASYFTLGTFIYSLYVFLTSIYMYIQSVQSVQRAREDVRALLTEKDSWQKRREGKMCMQYFIYNSFKVFSHKCALEITNILG